MRPSPCTTCTASSPVTTRRRVSSCSSASPSLAACTSTSEPLSGRAGRGAGVPVRWLSFARPGAEVCCPAGTPVLQSGWRRTSRRPDLCHSTPSGPGGVWVSGLSGGSLRSPGAKHGSPLSGPHVLRGSRVSSQVAHTVSLGLLCILHSIGPEGVEWHKAG